MAVATQPTSLIMSPPDPEMSEFLTPCSKASQGGIGPRELKQHFQGHIATMRVTALGLKTPSPAQHTECLPRRSPPDPTSVLREPLTLALSPRGPGSRAVGKLGKAPSCLGFVVS